MKSADEWNEIMRDDAGYFEAYPEAEDFIRAIQRDALQAAAEVCRKREDRNRNTAANARNNWDRKMLSARADADGLCADSILALLPPTPSATSGEML